MNYYTRLRGREDGPFDIEQLRRLRAQGRFSTLHEVSTDRRSWHKASALSEVFSTSPGTSSSVMPVLTRPVQSDQPQAIVPVEMPAPTPVLEWYYTHANQSFGPVQLDLLRNMIRNGQLSSDVQVWNPALGVWTAADHVEAFAGLQPTKLSIKRVPRWVATAVAATVLLCGATIVGWKCVSATSQSAVITDSDDENGLRDAVGRVFVGWTIKKDDNIIELPLVTGTGFSISPDGFVITNDHVVHPRDDAGTTRDKVEAFFKSNQVPFERQIWVFFGRDQAHKAQVVTSSQDPDLAILKLDHPAKKHFRLSSKEPSRRSDVYAIGFPGIAQLAQSKSEEKFQASLQEEATIATTHADKEFVFSLTHGVVSRSFPQEPLKSYWKIEHNAMISQGNSGGPLISRSGTVVGINTLGFKQEQLLGEIYYSLSVESLRKQIDAATTGVTWEP